VFEQAFKNIDDILWKEAGCTTELDYTEQTSWRLFLKYLDGLEHDKSDEAKLEGKTYAYILDTPYRWETWAAPKGKDGKLDHIDELRFRSQTEKHELSHLDEAKIKNMGNAGRNGGEDYTQRPLIRAIVQVVQPKIGERIYDGAVGSAGFLCESFDYLKSKGNFTTKDSYR
jgi:type I restriction enzyme M protein